MGLYIDHQPYKPSDLPKKEKDVNKVFIFKIWKTKKRWNELNQQWDIPAGFHCDMFYILEGREIRFATTATPVKGGKVYNPVDFTLDGKGEKIVNGQDVEFLWFMRNHPYCGENAIKRNAIPWFYEEDLEKEAEPLVAKGQTRARALELVFSKETGLQLEQMRVVGRSLYPPIPNVDTISKPELVIALEKRANADPELFIQTVDSPLLKQKSILHGAEKSGIIAYVPANLGWFFCDATGEMMPDQRICPVRGGEVNPMQVLAMYLEKEDKMDHFATIEKQAKARRKELDVLEEA